MKILITGSKGNIGRILCKHLEKKHKVYGIDLKQDYADNYMTADINWIADLEYAFQTFMPDQVIHLAGVVSRIVCERSPSLAFQTNIIGTSNVARLCRKYKAPLMFFSTSEVYGNQATIKLHEALILNPNNVYGLSKQLAEEIVNYEVDEGLNCVTVRPFMIYHENEIYGENHSAMIRIANTILNNDKMVIHKDTYRSWLHINDLVDIVDKLLEVPGSATVNIGNPDLILTTDLAKMMCGLLNKKFDKHFIEQKMPPKMTARKDPDLAVQNFLTLKKDFISVNEGAGLVFDKILQRKLKK